MSATRATCVRKRKLYTQLHTHRTLGARARARLPRAPSAILPLVPHLHARGGYTHAELSTYVAG